MWLAVTLSVQKASAKNAYCVYGHPSPFAFIGFAHALCIKAQIKQKGGVLAVFHDIEMHATANTFNEFCFDLIRSAQRDTKGASGSKGKTQLDTPMANMEVSICFEICSANFDGFKNKLKDALETMRFAGGVISASSFRLCETADEAFRIKAGFAMCAASIQKGERNIFERMLSAISLHKGKKGWINPSLVGFRMIEAPCKDRDGVRGGYMHAYADPLIGIVEFRSVRKVTVKDMWTIQKNGRLINFVTQNLLIDRECATMKENEHD